jgi:hypothetical protein
MWPTHLHVQCVPEVSLRKYSSRSVGPTNHLHLTPRFTRIHDVVRNHAEGDLYLYHEQYTVGYAGTNVIGSVTSFVIASVRSIIRNTLKYISVLWFRASCINKWKHQLDATVLSVYFTAIVHSTCFGCHIHPSSGVSNMYNQVWYNLITV